MLAKILKQVEKSLRLLITRVDIETTRGLNVIGRNSEPNEILTGILGSLHVLEFLL